MRTSSHDSRWPRECAKRQTEGVSGFGARTRTIQARQPGFRLKGLHMFGVPHSCKPESDLRSCSFMVRI